MESKEQMYFLKDLKPNMKRVSSMFIVLEIGSTTRTKDGNEVRTFKVADRTGTINLTVWNEKASLISPCDMLQLIHGNTTVRNGCLTLNVGRFGQLTKVGEFSFLFLEQPDHSSYNEEWAKQIDQPQIKKQSEPQTNLDMKALINKISRRCSTADEILKLERLCVASSDDSDELVSILLKHLRDSDSRIRLAVIRIIEHLTSASSLPTKFSLNLRDKILTRLTEVIPLVLPTNTWEADLPPPSSAAEEVRRMMLTLLLVWEAELSSSDKSTQCLTLQTPKDCLESCLRHLRGSDAQSESKLEQRLLRGWGVTPVRLNHIRSLLATLEETKRQQELEQKRKDLAVFEGLKQQLLTARVAFQDRRCLIEENLTTLKNGLELLLSVELDDVLTHTSSPPQDLDSELPFDPREHGTLDSSGVSFTLPMAQVDALNVPRLKVKLNDTSDILRASLEESALLAINKHRSILHSYLKLIETTSSMPSLSFAGADRELVENLLSLTKRLIAQFYALEFEEAKRPTEAITPRESDLEEPSDSESNFVEVSSSGVLMKELSSEDSSELQEIDNAPSTSMAFNLLEDYETADSRRHFRKPNKSLEGQSVDRLKAVTSMSTYNERRSLGTPTDSPLEITALSGGPLEKQGGSSQLACWVPMDSGKLCPYRNIRGQCRIHGRVMPRDPKTGHAMKRRDILDLQKGQLRTTMRFSQASQREQHLRRCGGEGRKKSQVVRKLTEREESPG